MAGNFTCAFCPARGVDFPGSVLLLSVRDIYPWVGKLNAGATESAVLCCAFKLQFRLQLKRGIEMRAVSSIRLALAILACACLTPLYAQYANATIKGIVTDPSGAAVVGAAVELINSGTGERRQATTSSSGNYDFTALPPGEYEV